VIWPYVDLYVTDHTVDLGEDGEQALRTLERTAAAAGALPKGTPPLRVLGSQTPLVEPRRRIASSETSV
jgi:predicted solute-binding protein